MISLCVLKPFPLLPLLGGARLAVSISHSKSKLLSLKPGMTGPAALSHSIECTSTTAEDTAAGPAEEGAGRV